MALVRRETGIAQVPAVELPDGRWLTDTTPIIAWLESQLPEPAVIPRDPLQAFFSLLLEDYGDEWLWRPAMHYRWHYRADAILLSRKIVDELARDIPLPVVVKRFAIRARQRRLFLRRDGVSSKTLPHVESIYRRTLDQLQAIFSTRPFLLGEVPTLADFGFFASMFRHFGMDPTPATIMRETASEVYAWVARVWNARASHTGGALVPGIPADWGPILDEIGTAYLPHLSANAQAWKDGRKHFDVDIQGTRYAHLRTARYRVWCLEEIRRCYEELPERGRDEARALLEKHGCWEPLWQIDKPGSGIDPERNAPFAGGYSMTGL
jgi:glutathione S-transferase